MVEDQKFSNQKKAESQDLDWSFKTITPSPDLIRKSKILALRRDNFFKKVGIIFLIIFILTGAGIATATIIEGDFYWMRDLVGLGIPKDSFDAVEKIGQKMDELKTVHSETQIDFIVLSEGTSIRLPIEVKGDIIFPDKEKVELTFKTKSLVSAFSSFIPDDIADDLKNIKMEYISTGSKVFYKIPKIFGNLWIEDSQDNFYSTGSVLENYSDLRKTLDKVEKMPSVTIDSERCYHYKLIFNTKRFFEDLTGDDLSSEESVFLLNGMQIEGEIWASKKDFLIRKMTLNMSFEFPTDVIEQIASLFKKRLYISLPELDLNQVLGTRENKDIKKGYRKSQNQALIKIEVKYSNFNWDIEIESPKKSKKITEISEDDITDSPLGRLISSDIEASQNKARDSIRKSDLYQIATALELYTDDSDGVYPVSDGVVKIDGTGDILSKSLGGNYLNDIPLDPQFPEYYYSYYSDGKSYELICMLENQTDLQEEKVGDRYIFKINSLDF